jgi:hypothetical protein
LYSLMYKVLMNIERDENNESNWSK